MEFERSASGRLLVPRTRREFLRDVALGVIISSSPGRTLRSPGGTATPILVLAGSGGDYTARSVNGGATWTTVAGVYGNGRSAIAFFAKAQLFVAVGTAMTIETSPDGLVWTGRQNLNNGFNYGAVVAGANQATALSNLTGASGNQSYYSDDGLTWTHVPAVGGTNTCGVNGAAYDSGSGAFAAGGFAHGWSTDGKNWTTAATGSNIKCVASSGAGTFVYLGSSGNWFSTDGGATLQVCVTPPGATMNGAAYGAGTFVAVGVNTSYVSTDGSNWSAKTIPNGTYNGICYSLGLGKFVAVGQGVSAIFDGTSWVAGGALAGVGLGVAANA